MTQDWNGQFNVIYSAAQTASESNEQSFNELSVGGVSYATTQWHFLIFHISSAAFKMKFMRDNVKDISELKHRCTTRCQQQKSSTDTFFTFFSIFLFLFFLVYQ